MTFRLPEGDTLWIKTKIRQKLEISFKSKIISYAKLYKEIYVRV